MTYVHDFDLREPDAKAVRLAKLALSEVSGVDQPANLLPGFMVQKARGTESLLRKAREKGDLESALAVLRGIVSGIRTGLEQVHTVDWSALASVPTDKRRDVIIKAAALAHAEDGTTAPTFKRHTIRHPETGRFTQHPVRQGTGLFKPAPGGVTLKGSLFFGTPEVS